MPLALGNTRFIYCVEQDISLISLCSLVSYHVQHIDILVQHFLFIYYAKYFNTCTDNGLQ